MTGVGLVYTGFALVWTLVLVLVARTLPSLVLVLVQIKYTIYPSMISSIILWSKEIYTACSFSMHANAVWGNLGHTSSSMLLHAVIWWRLYMLIRQETGLTHSEEDVTWSFILQTLLAPLFAPDQHMAWAEQSNMILTQLSSSMHCQMWHRVQCWWGEYHEMAFPKFH